MSVDRIAFESLQEPLAGRLSPKVERLGYFGEFFQCTAHQPEALDAFMVFTEALQDALPKKLVEVVSLTVANWCRNSYERNQHERLSVRLGYGRDWVAAVGALRPEDQPLLSGDERLVQRTALSVLETQGHETAPLFARLVEVLGQQQAIAVLMLTGRYFVHASVVNTLQLAAPVPSIFEDGFTG
ncbi:carboxymuconolactone decarboxylase family protein [Novosphingobium beihaiensis]|uniref:Alkylhydroperoxidase family enzyme n=1 Tax=Novosphingobium beihaiensis TaxID=2930389 RepID=A0ABT0BRW7_9SPHN|nr:hypothetical protein [Novosphingobium beihaiensis]MCJ2187623.1 hypothetical protein [Novosphingobium beihaiensis]